MYVFLDHTFLALVAPDHSLRSQEVRLTEKRVGSCSRCRAVVFHHRRVPFVKEVFRVRHIASGTSRISIHIGITAVHDLIAFLDPLFCIVISVIPEVKLEILRQIHILKDSLCC